MKNLISISIRYLLSCSILVMITFFCNFGLAQTTITLQPTVVKHNTNSHIIGVCRNHVKEQSDANANFTSMVSQYNAINPVFGSQKKLYRLGGSQIDGLVCGYGGYNYQNHTGLNGPYPHDDIVNFTNEANSINADMIMGVNFGTGTPALAANLVQYLQTNNLLNKVKFFELGNEINEPHQKGHITKACNPKIYASNVKPFITQMKAINPSIKLGLCASTNSFWAWNRGGFPNEICANFNSNYCSSTDYDTRNGVQTMKDLLDTLGKDNFDYIIFHAYPSYPIVNAAEEIGYNCSTFIPMTDDEMAKHILAQNEWSINNRIIPLTDTIALWKSQNKLKSTFQIANTEAFTHVHELHRPNLVQSTTEALFSADNMLTAFKYDFASSINFAFYHHGTPTDCNGNVTELSPNIMFGYSNGLAKPSFKVHKLLAENLGDVVISDSDVSMPIVGPFTGQQYGGSYSYKKLSYLSTKKNSDGSLFVLIVNRSVDAVTVNLVPNISFSSAQIKSIQGLSYTDKNPTETAFTNIANLASFSVPKLSVNIVKIIPQTCSNVTNAGTIAGAQTNCVGYNPTNITSSTAASGGSGTLVYSWESSTTSSSTGFTVISGATLATYDPPSITQTTWYRRGALRTPCTTPLYSNVIAKTVSNVSNAGTISGNENNCVAFNPGLISSTAPASGGSGAISYQWQLSTTSPGTTGFSNISGATGLTYDPPSNITVSTWYRRGARTGSCTFINTTAVAKTISASCCPVNETFVRSALASNCRTYTLTVSPTANATNAVYTLAGLPGNGYDVAGSSWTSGTNFVFTAPTFITTASWTIPTVTVGSTYTLVLKYCFSSPFTCPTFSITTNGCNKVNIAANCAAMILPNPDPNTLVGNEEVVSEDGSLQVFPNPNSNGILNFKANVVNNKKAELIIFNNIGQKVLVRDVEKIDIINELDIKSLPVGPYTLTLKCEGCPKLFARFMVIKDN